MNNLYDRYTAKDILWNRKDMQVGVFCYLIADMGKGNKPKQNAMFWYSPGSKEIKLTYLTNTDLKRLKIKGES